MCPQGYQQTSLVNETKEFFENPLTKKPTGFLIGNTSQDTTKEDQNGQCELKQSSRMTQIPKQTSPDSHRPTRHNYVVLLSH